MRHDASGSSPHKFIGIAVARFLESLEIAGKKCQKSRDLPEGSENQSGHQMWISPV
jgi:hypothetical protein